MGCQSPGSLCPCQPGARTAFRAQGLLFELQPAGCWATSALYFQPKIRAIRPGVQAVPVGSAVSRAVQRRSAPGSGWLTLKGEEQGAWGAIITSGHQQKLNVIVNL